MQFDPDEEPTNPSIQRARILVVEDCPTFRRLVTKRLERDGYAVYEAATGDGALVALHFIQSLAWPTDDLELVILDHHLPGCTGLEILQRMRDAQDSTPVLLMTAFPDASTLGEAGGLGAAVLCKPFPLDRLCDAAIEAIVSRGES
jgi:DNA-binding response OmpR family regulator